MPKIVIIGGGSFSWGPLFIRDLGIAPELAGSQIVLHDIDPQALDLVYRLGQKAIMHGDFDISLERTTQLDEALSGAHFVILSISTGGLEAMRHDLEIPAKYGIYHTVGDTVGPGGLARGLRNIPVVIDIAGRMERHCPDAWLLNYSNPLTTLTRAVTKETSIKTIGFCHEWLGVRYKLAQLLAVEESDFQPRIAGINHLIWLLDLKAAGQDLMPALSDLAGQILTGDGRLFGDDDMTSMVDRGKVKARLLQVYGAMPVAGDRHVAEFFPGFLTEATAQGQTYGLERTSVEERYQWREWDKRRLCDLLHDKLDIAPFLEKPSGEAAHSLISALATHARYTGIMNLPNQGQIANLPPDVVVETYAVVDSSGISGLSMGPLPPGIQAVVSRHVANQEMIVEAALTGDIHLARQALLNDPLVTVEPDGAERMLDEMLLANQAYLPQFFG